MEFIVIVIYLVVCLFIYSKFPKTLKTKILHDQFTKALDFLESIN